MDPAPNFVKVYEFNHCLVDLGLREIVIGNRNIHPDADVFDTLVFLIENRDHAVGLEEFKRDLWHDSAVTEFEIAHCILKARKLLGDHSAKHQIIVSTDGGNYRFMPEVLEMEIESFS